MNVGERADGEKSCDRPVNGAEATQKIAGAARGSTFSHMRPGLLLLLSTFLACGPSVVDQSLTSSRCLSLSEPEGGLTVALPSRVGWLFKVDTCGGEPVSGLSAAQFEIFEDGKQVSAFESQQRVAPKGERFRLYSVVLLDLSGSMLRSGDFAQVHSRRAAMDTASR
jgi:hypothetical protein